MLQEDGMACLQVSHVSCAACFDGIGYMLAALTGTGTISAASSLAESEAACGRK